MARFTRCRAFTHETLLDFLEEGEFVLAMADHEQLGSCSSKQRGKSGFIMAHVLGIPLALTPGILNSNFFYQPLHF